MDAVILAGGKGIRMGSALPKALTEIKGRTLIDAQLFYLFHSGIDKVVLALGYGAVYVIEHVQTYWPEQYREGRIIYSVEDSPLGTAGALKKGLRESSGDYVLVLNVDDITDINIMDLASMKSNTICVANPTLPYGLVIEKGGYAVFLEKPKIDSLWASCGWYLLERDEALSKLPDIGSLEYDVFQTGRIKMGLYRHGGFWWPINTPKDAQAFEEAELPEPYKSYFNQH